MPTRSAQAEWRGDLQQGRGSMWVGEGTEVVYTSDSRFESGSGGNPEELIAAAHAGCFSMALSAALARAGFPPTRIRTKASVRLERLESGFGITGINLETEGEVPGIDEATFRREAEGAKQNCPVSKALAAVPEITLTARLVQG
ncbi:MAG TPA: OsmC family protein [Dehalococcoidia bacterium]|nr:OsmC family protein [Dehalococcoidia bacterium]